MRSIVSILFRPLKWLWILWFIFIFVLSAIVYYPIFSYLLKDKSRWPRAFWMKRKWARTALYLTGVSIKVHSEVELEKGKAYIYCPNHTSYLDVILSYIVLPTYFHYVGKYELMNVPLFNIFFKSGMDIAVNRKSIRQSSKAIARAKEDLMNGISIAIFPEGTVSTKAPEMQPFKSGPFKMAMETGASIVPITFVNNWLILPDEANAIKGGGPGKAKVVIHKPINFEEGKLLSIEELKLATQKVIKDQLEHEYRFKNS